MAEAAVKDGILERMRKELRRAAWTLAAGANLSRCAAPGGRLVGSSELEPEGGKR